MSIVIFAFFVAAIRFVFAHGADWLQPFYDRHVFDDGGCPKALRSRCLTYIGFDGISTLSEEAEIRAAYPAGHHLPPAC